MTSDTLEVLYDLLMEYRPISPYTIVGCTKSEDLLTKVADCGRHVFAVNCDCRFTDKNVTEWDMSSNSAAYPTPNTMPNRPIATLVFDLVDKSIEDLKVASRIMKHYEGNSPVIIIVMEKENDTSIGGALFHDRCLSSGVINLMDINNDLVILHNLER